MTTWEYLCFQIDTDGDIVKQLDDLGAKRWQLIMKDGDYFYFKRAKVDEEVLKMFERFTGLDLNA